MVTMHINRRDDLQSGTPPTTPSNASPPQNVHGDRAFLIKLQHTHGLGEGSFLVYDRKRSFTVYFMESKAPDVFRKFKAEIEGPRGGNYGGGMYKMYRWAKRVGDWELSVCLDKVPQEEIKW